ncbi:MAG: rod shape-determining protein MreC [Bacteroidales bacterium]|nr:rod shape-determining protein MreC [Bacteroidales bacterium]
MRRNSIITHILNAAIFIILEIAALNMLSHNGAMQNIWFSKGMHAIMGTLWGGTEQIKDYFSLRKVNDALAIENHNLRTRLARYVAEKEDSLMEAGFEEIAGNYRYTPATIMKISRNTQHNYMIIDKGSADGVVTGSGVITGKGAIGVIDAVSSNFSYAISFRNHEMNISARLGKEGAVGPLSWDGHSSSGAILKEIPHHVEFEPGDTVFTSGFSSIFPPDIPLGTTGESKIVNGATYEIQIELLEDFGALRYVTIVENLGKGEMQQLEDKR